MLPRKQWTWMRKWGWRWESLYHSEQYPQSARIVIYEWMIIREGDGMKTLRREWGRPYIVGVVYDFLLSNFNWAPRFRVTGRFVLVFSLLFIAVAALRPIIRTYLAVCFCALVNGAVWLYILIWSIGVFMIFLIESVPPLLTFKIRWHGGAWSIRRQTMDHFISFWTC